MDFDSSLGFPGEGPCLGLLLCLCLFLLPRFGSSLSHGFSLRTLLGFCALASSPGLPGLPGASSPCLRLSDFPFPHVRSHGPYRTPAERARAAWIAAWRAAQPALPQGRPVLPATNKLRDRFWTVFCGWLANEGIDFQTLLDSPTMCVEEINAILTRFGRCLYESGKPYNQYAETINQLTTLVPSLRRLMQGSWVLAFLDGLGAYLPPRSYAMAGFVGDGFSMPPLGVATSGRCFELKLGCAFEGWRSFGSWRCDLLLPRDVEGTVRFCILAILDPKTRHSGARHQAWRFQVVDLAFGALPESGDSGSKTYLPHFSCPRPGLET